MAVNVKSLSAIGIQRIYWSYRNSSGYAIGNAATLPSAGGQTAQPMGRLHGVKDFPFTPNEPEVVNVTGDDGAISQFQFNPIELPQGVMTTGVNDMAFAALAMGVSTFDVGGMTLMGLQPGDYTPVDFCLLTVSQAKDYTSGSSHYYGLFIPNVQVYYQGPTDMSERNAISFRWNLTANPSGYLPWGTALTSGTHGDTQFTAFEWTGPRPLMMDTWQGNNTQATFNLSEDIYEDTANNISVWVNGAAATWKSSGAGAGEFEVAESTTDSITLGTVPANGAVVQALYGIK